MRTFNFKLATISFAALLLASCSDSSNDSANGSNTPSNTTVVGSSVTSITDAQELAARVTNYKVSTSTTKTRAAGGISTRTYINREESAIDITTVSQLSKDVEYYVPKGKTETRSLDISDATVYVEGSLTYNFTGRGSVNVCDGGVLTAAESSDPFGSSDISCDAGGTIILPKNQSEVNIKGSFYYWKTDDLDFGNAVVNFNPTAPAAYGTQSLMALGNVKAKEVHLSNGAQIAIQESLTTDKLTLTDTNTMASVGCAINCSGEVHITDNANVSCTYIKAKSFKQEKNATVNLYSNYMLDISGEYNNQSEGCATMGQSGIAVVKCGKITFNAPADGSDGSVDCKIFNTTANDAYIIVDCANGVYDNSGKKVDVDYSNANVILSTDEEAKNYSITASECNPSGWSAPKEDPTPDDKKGRLDLISTIEYDTHDHDISATGIMPLDGKMYMSYHTRDTQHGGCVEVFDPVTDNKVTLKQYLYDTAQDLDFNHLLAVKKNNDEKMVYLPGSSDKKGGILAYLPIQSDGLLASASQEIIGSGEAGAVTYKEPLQFIQMNPATEEYAKGGYDENCVVYNEKTNQLIVMTTTGYIVYDADSYNEIQRVAKDGKAKHVAIGDGKIAMLYLNEKATSEDQEIAATVEVFDQNTTDFSTGGQQFSVSTIQPNNGKNVIAVDDGKIYVCRGGAGMYVYNLDGTEAWHYQMPSAQIQNETSEKYGNYKALANGLFVDDNYVYVAYGSYGLVVIDKNSDDHKVVARKAVKKSANYVTVSDGYIYVAYGKSRLQVFKLYTGEM